MSSKKLKIIAIAIICLPILLCAGAFCTVVLGLFGSPYTELEADIPPYLVFADGTRYICSQTYYRGENPTDDEILGTIDSLIDSTKVPTKNGQTNFSECFGQPYTVRDGKLIIRRGKQLERPAQNADGSWRTEYYYIWYVCEPG